MLYKFTTYLLKLCSHCRSDQLARPDHPNSPTSSITAWLGLYATCSCVHWCVVE